MTELEQRDGRSVLRMRRRLDHPVDAVWQAITEPDGLAAWFPERLVIELWTGGRVTSENGTSGRVTEVDPPRSIAFTWDADHLRFDLVPDAAATVLHLTHTFDDRAGAASFAAGWETCLAVLAGAGEPDHRTLHEQYVVQFGLDEPTVSETADGWRVRVERQLVAPADVAAAHLPEAGDGATWELVDGTGHGARLVATWTGRDAACCAGARVELPRRVRAVAESIFAGRPPSRQNLA